MDRRVVATGFAVLALGVSLGILWQGFTCGMRSVSETCTTEDGCMARSECVSYLHPLTWPYVGLGLLAIGAAWLRKRTVLLAGAVAGAAAGTLYGMSLGTWGILVAALVLAAAFALPPRSHEERILAWAALGAILAPFVLLVGLTPILPAAPVVYVAILGPGLAWLALAAVTGMKKKEEASP